jgi:hypothetical protein
VGHGTIARVRLTLWLALTLPSLSVVFRYFGWSGVAASAIASLAVTMLVPRVPLPASPRWRVALALATLLAIVVVFAALFPAANSHLPGVGSDDDDAYDTGVRALLSGRSPYAARTYLGNELHQLPGAFFLAMPFTLLGTSALQNIFWGVLFYLALRREAAGDDGPALRGAWVMLAGAPVVLHQIVTGTGHLANALYVWAGLWWLLRTGATPAAVFWGVALASRANFVLLFPLAFGYLWQKRGVRSASRLTIIAGASWLAMTLPFYLLAPGSFGPLEAANRLTRVDLWIAHGGLTIGVVTMVLALGLAAIRLTWPRMMLACAAVLALPILLVAGIEAWVGGWTDFSFWTYGIFALPFVVAAQNLSESAHSRTRRAADVSIERRPGAGEAQELTSAP